MLAEGEYVPTSGANVRLDRGKEGADARTRASNNMEAGRQKKGE